MENLIRLRTGNCSLLRGALRQRFLIFYVDCLSIYSKLTKDRSTILEGVLNKGKVSDCSIFYLEGVGSLYTVVRMDLVESILRRGAKGLELNEVKLADE